MRTFSRRRGPGIVAWLCAAMLAWWPSSARQAAAQAPTFRGDTRLIVQTVSVTDRDGRPIEGLTADDFVVTEDGERQTVSLVEYQRLTVPASAVDVTPDPVPPGDATPTAGTIAGAAPGELRYRDRRLVVLYFDLTALPPADLQRAYQAARQYLLQSMTPIDLVALMSFEGGAVRVTHDFSDQRASLLEALQRLIFGGDLDGDGIPDVDTDTGTAFGQDDAEFNILNTDRQLAALQTAASMLRALPDRKSLVYFSSGLRLNGVDNQAQLRATTNAALRASVSIYPIDARGLVASAPLGDATQQSATGSGAFTGRAAERVIDGRQRSQDTLYALAADTGGRALFDDNDLTLGIRRAADALTSYYIVGYYSTHTALDGRFHRVRIALRDGRPGQLAYREGYFAERAFQRFSAADKERQLEEALMAENPITDMSLAMEVNYFQLNRAEYFVPVTVKIPGSELTCAGRGGARRTVIDLIGEVKDDFGVTLQNVRDKIDIRLDAATARDLPQHPVQYDTGFTLLPGRYVIKILARDAETGRIGTFQAAFTVPNLNREETALPISSVVLGTKRVPLGDAVYTVAKNAALDVNPLVANGQKLLPSVTRVFTPADDLLVYLQAYERGADAMRPLVAQVSLFADGEARHRFSAVAVTEGMHPRSKAVPLSLAVPLAGVSPGRYDLQVTVLDPAGRQAAFWRAPVVVRP